MTARYVDKGSRRLRCGYTTGSCAAAAAKAAALLLLQGTAPDEITIPLPDDSRLTLPVASACKSPGAAVCGVRKDSGDDPDVTNGITVLARVQKLHAGTEITGGEGIGRITRPGLDQPVGAWAINSVPRRMITLALAEAAAQCSYTGGFRAELSVPGGRELAEKTYNPHMGIVGGLSIIGTTGIVEPMSTAALVDTIRLEARMHYAAGQRILLLTPGNYGREFLRRKLPAKQAVQCSNFIGEALDIGIAAGFSGILIAGHVGKLVKLGAGIMNTHSAVADGRMETLVTCGLLAGASPAVLRPLPDCVTVDAALALLKEDGSLTATMQILTARIDRYLRRRVRDAVRVGAVLFSLQYPDIWQSPEGAALLQELMQQGSGA